MTEQVSPDHVRDARGRRRIPAIVHVLCLVWAVFVIIENVQETLWFVPGGTVGTGGTIGADFGDLVGSGYVRIDNVDRNGPMAGAGAVSGDTAKFDRPYYYLRRRIWPGEQIGLTLAHGAHVKHVTVETVPRPAPAGTLLNWLQFFYDVATAIGALFGLFIILRSRRNPTTWLLGMALLTYGLITTFPELWFSGAFIFPLADMLGEANLFAISVLFYAFAASFYRDTVGAITPFAFRTYAIVVAAFWAFDEVAGLLAIDAMSQSTLIVLENIIFNIGYVLGFYYIVRGWRRSAADVQQRYALLLVATAAIVAAQASDVAIELVDGENFQLAFLAVNIILSLGIAYPLFTYAILRHKVFDLGFAVNRTLVYSVVSAILLAAFALIEWAVGHFVPMLGREKNALIDAAFALGVSLTFHRLSGVVEHGIERLFFRRWQEAEAALRRFVRESAFVRSPETLARAFAAALSRFADGASIAVYLMDDSTQPRKAASARDASPEELDVDDPALVALRAELKPVEPAIVGSHIAAALCVPMVNRNEVVGVVLLGQKESRMSYRPDEIDLIGWATHQVGLDLYALKIEQLEQERSELRVELRSANTQIDRLLELRSAQA
jgi:GAF domain-containing protein